jgi:phage shock protein PspC (stress-responsive transcriptional regulator)
MNKTISVTLGGLIFNLEEEAYQKLNQYLSDVRNSLGNSTDKNEVMSDIEASIAEKFSKQISDAKQVITLTDIEELIKVMGTIEDFDQELKETGDKKEDKDKTEEKSLKKLYRNPDDVVIAGVCSGIAMYFGIDAVIIRLLFVLSVFFGGFGIPLYIVLWIIIPEAKNSSQKLEMSGDPVTLAAIEQVIKKNVNKVKEQKNNEKLKSSFRRLIELPLVLLKAAVTVIKKIAKAFVPIIAGIVGFGFFLVGIMSIIGLSVALCALIFNAQNPYLASDIFIKDLISEPLFKLFLVGIYLVIIIPISFLMTIGISLMRRKNAFTLLIFSSTMGLWMIGLMLVATIGFKYAPQIEAKTKEYEAQAVIMKNFNLNDFDSISSSNDLNIKVIKGENYTITASGTKNDLDSIKAEVVDKELQLNREDKKGFCIFCLYNRPVQLTITMPNFKDYKAGDATRLKTEGFVEDNFTINLKDAAQADITADIKNINIKQSDASKFTLASMATTSSSTVMTVSLNDAANLYAYNFPVDTLEIKLRGASFAEITVNKTITATVWDASKIYYKGEAKVNENIAPDDESVIDPAAKIIKVNTTDRVIK